MDSTVNGHLLSISETDCGEVPATRSLLAGNPPEKLLDDNAYVLFLRCKQAPPTPELRVPLPLLDYVKEEDKKQ